MTLGIALGRLILSERSWERQRREAHFAKWPRRCFVKVTGDLFLSLEFHHWVAEMARTSGVVISIGGGTRINTEFARRGISFSKHPRLGRETSSEGYQLAASVLKDSRRQQASALAERDAIVEIMLPIITMHGIKCHIDGDIMVLNAYWGFDELYVVTTPERVETKRAVFTDMPKVRVIGMVS